MSLFSKLPQAVIYDFDGTILDTAWAIYETWQTLYQAEGQELPIPIYAQCIGSGFHTWSPETHLEELTGKSYDWKQIHEERVAALSEFHSEVRDGNFPYAPTNIKMHDGEKEKFLEELDK